MASIISELVNVLAAWVVRRRADFPAPVRRLVDAVAQKDTWVSRLVLRSSGNPVPEPINVPTKSIRLYIGPTNYAGQAYEWAHAVERAFPTVAARNASFSMSADFAFPSDYRIPMSSYQASTAWHTAQLASLERYTHAIIESFTPLLGNHWSGSIPDEVRDLRSHGLAVGFMCHGTDIRLPSRHSAQNRWSPFGTGERSDALEQRAMLNAAVLRETGGPVFVSTPDLLTDVPDAMWCPVVVQPSRWIAAGVPLFERSRPQVVHIPSARGVKGTDLISDAMQSMHDSGEIEYRVLTGVPSDRMPIELGAADIVLDQFRIGSYGVAACEAMAAGRVVIGHVVPKVRATVFERSGLRLPIVEANPDTIADTIAEVIANQDKYRSWGAAGFNFVERVHKGAFSASVLQAFLGISNPQC